MQPAMAIPSVFVVILDEVLVAQDIGSVIRDLWAEAMVVVARSVPDAEALVPEGPLRAIFLQRDTFATMGSALISRLHPGGGSVVLVGHEPGLAPDGYHVLPIPFSTEDVRSVLASLIRT